MPLMMNEDMDIDISDLFDDGTGLSLPSRPPPKELFQRVDELRGSGCCQYEALIKLKSYKFILLIISEEWRGPDGDVLHLSLRTGKI